MNGNRKKKVKLQLDSCDEPLLIAISSPEPLFKLSILINARLNLKMKSNVPLTIQRRGKGEVYFERFSDLSGSPEISYSLISNRTGAIPLVEQLPKIDYLLVCNNRDAVEEREGINKLLKEIPAITAIFNVDRNNISNEILETLQSH